MRRSLLRSAVLPATAALVLLTGCSGSEDEDATASQETSAAESSAAETSAAETSAADAADSEFCTEATSSLERLTGSASSAGDPSELPQIFRGAAEEIRGIEAPDELASDWNALADGAEQFASTLENVDLTDPDAMTTLQQQLAPLEQELNEASTNVQNYLGDECGVDVSTEESAPTS
ncbi:hypothetical protein ABC795_16280 [Blastococcus sp. HT6-30]|uniref:hypothetical protein n=1 Tax=Blastococcus sp. HT6-30 TaxID=3144843 RepID=UPI00321A0384